MITNSIEFSKTDMIKNGIEIVNNNPFYHTLYLLLKYYFVKKEDMYLPNFTKSITNSENEFKVFMVYVEFSIYMYTNYLTDVFGEKDGENLVYGLISYVKTSYDSDRKILSPFINSITENEVEVLEKFHIVKLNYKLNQDSVDRFNKLNDAVMYLEKSKELEIESKRYSDMALDMLQELKTQFRKSIYNKDVSKLMIKNI
jgi:hypothetical protein